VQDYNKQLAAGTADPEILVVSQGSADPAVVLRQNRNINQTLAPAQGLYAGFAELRLRSEECANNTVVGSGLLATKFWSYKASIAQTEAGSSSGIDLFKVCLQTKPA